MKKGLLFIAALLASNAYGYNPATREQQVLQTNLLTEIEANTAGGGGSNASVGANGDPAPASSTQVGFEDGSGDLVNVSATNPLPITGSISASNPSVGSTGAATPASATNIGGTDGTNLRSIKTDAGGELQIDVLSSALPTGASTSALQTTGNTSLSSIDTKTPPLGAADTANSTPVTMATDQSPISVNGSGFTQPISAAALPLPTGASTAAHQVSGNTLLSSIDAKIVNDYGPASSGIRTASQIGNGTGAADFDAGNSSGQTLRTVIASDQTPIPVNATVVQDHAYVDSVYFDYATDGPVDSTNWTEIVSALAGDAFRMHIFDSCGEALELGTGTAGNETRVFIIAPGGPSAVVDLNVASGETLSIRSLGATCSSGILTITFLD